MKIAHINKPRCWELNPVITKWRADIDDEADINDDAKKSKGLSYQQGGYGGTKTTISIFQFEFFLKSLQDQCLFLLPLSSHLPHPIRSILSVKCPRHLQAGSGLLFFQARWLASRSKDHRTGVLVSLNSERQGGSSSYINLRGSKARPLKKSPSSGLSSKSKNFTLWVGALDLLEVFRSRDQPLMYAWNISLNAQNLKPPFFSSSM